VRPSPLEELLPASRGGCKRECNVIDSKVLLRHRNLKLHWASPEGWFASRGYEIWFSSDEGASWARIGALRTGWAARCSRYPFLAQAGRLGIHNLLRLSTGALICVADGVLYRSADQGATFVPTFSEFHGRRPLPAGMCQDHTGRIYLGEYSLNKERNAVRLWRSDDDGLTWHPVHTWPSGTVRHIHFVQFDPYEQLIWVGTGDDDSECHIVLSQDGGVSFEAIGGGSQVWRAVSVLFTPEAILWGTDIGIGHDDQSNYLVRWDRSMRVAQRLMRIDGPAYYSAQTSLGILAIGTAVERGKNEKDGRVHLYWTKDKIVWNNIRLWPRWRLPGVFGPSTITFPLSNAPPSRLLFNSNFVMSRFNGSLFEVIA
jgi:hypothetical protein